MDDLNNKEERSLLTQLLDDSKLYKEGKNFKELLDFVIDSAILPIRCFFTPYPKAWFNVCSI